MRIVIVSKALVVGAYQRKLEEIARLPGVHLVAVVPPSWRDRRGSIAVQKTYTAGYELEIAPLVFNGSYHLHFYPTLSSILGRLRPDILHVDEEPYNLATWHALKSGQTVGAQSLFFSWQNLYRRYPWPFGYFERANYRIAAHAIAGNQAAAGVLRAKGYGGPLSVIPQFGVDPDDFSAPRTAAEAAASSCSQGSSFRIGYAGGLVPEKGIDMLLHASARLPFHDWSLAILGTGPEQGHLQAMAHTLGIDQQVCFLGHRPSTEMPGFYRTLDVLVLPSRTRANWMEQFGRVLVEAMACGVPVVGSNSGEIPHVIGEAGIVFPEGDEGALCRALHRLAFDATLRSEIGELGRARVLRHFTQTQVAAATYGVYQAMLASTQS